MSACLCGLPKSDDENLMCPNCNASQKRMPRHPSHPGRALRDAVGIAGKSAVQKALGLDERGVWLRFVGREPTLQTEAEKCRRLIDPKTRVVERPARAEDYIYRVGA